ncbi:6-bladed beta-propeller [Aromatoleum toluvorans]|uniref:6-bladed beta-propeller n=1 Tax=Aromatoleum toluvorans TaxID=92002 RepID=UPI001FE8E164|nr:6-bladed beta-propeller [Aromatoleum toluvorans]
MKRTVSSALPWLILALAISMAGCATQSTPARLHYGLLDAPEGKRLMWPAEPEVPRYQFAGQLTGEENFVREGESKGVGRFFAWVVGLMEEEKPNVLQRPQAVAVDERERIFVSDVSRAAVFVFDKPAGELKVWEYAVGLRRFVSPIGVALAEGGGIWVADSELQVVAHLDAQGNPLPPIGAGVLQRPTGIARDPATGLLYVADTYAHDIKVFGTDGRLEKIIGERGEAPGEFNFPTHIAVAHGKLYVTDTMNSRVQAIPLEGDAKPQIIGRRGLYYGNLVRPKGVAVDSENNIYIVESYYDNLLIFNESGDFLMPIGGVGQGTGNFYLPAGVWVDSFNRVFVADTFNGRVTIFQYLGGAKADEE